MKILHIVEDFSTESAGVRTVVKNLDEQLNLSGFKSYIISSNKEEGDMIFLVDCIKNPWLYSKKWKRKIHKVCLEKKIDIIHIHGVWMYPQYIAAKYAISNSIPFVISSHGMYEPFHWTEGTLKKKIYFNLLIKNLFSKASIIHTITSQESINIQKLFKKVSLYEIPNLISAKNVEFDVGKATFKDKYILYLGRLNSKKGIDILLRAFKEVDSSDFKLKITGSSNKYKKGLDELIVSLRLEQRVEFLGLIKGENKIEVIKNAFVLVTPSHSEVIGMVNLEAAILKTPVITTYQTGLNPLWNKNGGILINPNKEELVKSLVDVFGWTNEERIKKGEKLYKFVLENYTWEEKISEWDKLYSLVLQKLS